jgi:hypothetical protein
LLNAFLSSHYTDLKEDPVLSVWISSDSHYAFVEYKSAEEANKGLELDKITIMSQTLKVGRPKTFQGNFGMIDTNAVCNTVASLQLGTINTPIIGRKVIFPYRILCFENLVKEIDDSKYMMKFIAI